VKVAGGPNGEFWELVRSEDYGEIDGEYEYTIDVGQTTPQLPEIERAQWMAFLGLIGQNPWMAQSPGLVKKMAELHHIYDETLVDELVKLATGQVQAAAQQAAAKAGGVGGMPGVMQQNPAAIGGGTAAGVNNIRGGQQ
jgi:hypothetical protein